MIYVKEKRHLGFYFVFLICYLFISIKLQELIFNFNTFPSPSYSQRHSFELLPLYFSKDMDEKSYNMKIGRDCLIPIYGT